MDKPDKKDESVVSPSLGVLAKNLEKVIEHSRLSRKGWAESFRPPLDVKAVERVERQMHSPRLKFLDELAGAMGMEGWQALHPAGVAAHEPLAGLDPRAVQVALELDRIMKRDAEWGDFAYESCKFALGRMPTSVAERMAQGAVGAQAPQPTQAPLAHQQTPSASTLADSSAGSAGARQQRARARSAKR